MKGFNATVPRVRPVQLTLSGPEWSALRDLLREITANPRSSAYPSPAILGLAAKVEKIEMVRMIRDGI